MKNPAYIDELIAQCNAEFNTDPRDVLEAIADPQWENRNKVHDWRTHVKSSIQDLWQHLSLDARIALYLDAAVEAGWEEWD